MIPLIIISCLGFILILEISKMILSEIQYRTLLTRSNLRLNVYVVYNNILYSMDGQLKVTGGSIFRTLKSSGPEHKKQQNK